MWDWKEIFLLLTSRTELDQEVNPAKVMASSLKGPGKGLGASRPPDHQCVQLLRTQRVLASRF